MRWASAQDESKLNFEEIRVTRVWRQMDISEDFFCLIISAVWEDGGNPSKMHLTTWEIESGCNESCLKCTSTASRASPQQVASRQDISLQFEIILTALSSSNQEILMEFPGNRQRKKNCNSQPLKPILFHVSKSETSWHQPSQVPQTITHNEAAGRREVTLSLRARPLATIAARRDGSTSTSHPIFGVLDFFGARISALSRCRGIFAVSVIKLTTWFILFFDALKEL